MESQKPTSRGPISESELQKTIRETIDIQDYRALELQEAGFDIHGIAKALKVLPSTAQKMIAKARARMTPEQLLEEFPDSREIQQRVKIKEMLNEMDPFDVLVEACKDAGLPKPLMKALQQRLYARTLPVEEPDTSLTPVQTAEKMEAKARYALQHMDAYTFASAPVKDLAYVIDALTKNAQLLRGQPTQIIGIEDRRKINELIPILIEDAKRRGLEVEDAELADGSG